LNLFADHVFSHSKQLTSAPHKTSPYIVKTTQKTRGLLGALKSRERDLSSKVPAVLSVQI
jgi:hypothetical protein